MPPPAVHPAAVVLAAAVAVLTATAQPPVLAPSPPIPADAVKALDRMTAASKYPLKHDAKKAEQVRQHRIAWYTAGGIDVYEKTANPNNVWHLQARAALATYPRVRTQIELSTQPDAILDSIVQKQVQAAAAAGSTDPLIRFLAEWPKLQHGTPDPKLVPRFGETVDALCRSEYGDVYKMTAAYNWLNVVQRVPDGDPLVKTEKAAADRFWGLFERVAADPHPSAGHAVIALAKLHEGLGAEKLGRTRRQNYEQVAARLKKAPVAVPLAVEGGMLIREGWDARGTGPAATVTPEGAQTFVERLRAARTALEAAWEADPTRPEAPTLMLMVCRGLGLEREVLEEWFARALATNPHNREAVQSKLDTLHPKWGGTTSEYLGFAWAVAKSPNIEGQFPLAAVASHFGNAPVMGPRYERTAEQVVKYYAQPTVWATVQTAMDRQLQASPKNVFLRTVYARVAGAAKRYDIAHAQFQALGGEFYPTYFANREEFDRWAGEARRAVEMKK
ncbi:MAG TPA: hypothetical protein VD866_12345 [Urbifossiella sp.]|nr:hypothetical protein [Urbifossiella sp.]